MRRQQGHADRQGSVPGGIEVASVDAFSGLEVVSHLEDGQGAVHRGWLDVRDDRRGGDDRRPRWQDGCRGPRRTVGALDFGKVEENFPTWQKYTRAWVKRAARGSGVSGGPEGTRTSYFYGSGFYPFGRSWGGIFAPSELCEPRPPEPTPCIELDPASVSPKVLSIFREVRNR
jgi:hypothetical protein